MKVGEFYKEHGRSLALEQVGTEADFDRLIKKAEVQSPGLSLAGYLKNFSPDRMLVFGKEEIEYLKELPVHIRKKRLGAILSETTPAVVIARRYKPHIELVELCRKYKIPLFRSSLGTMGLISKIILLLSDAFAPVTMIHGTLVEIFGVGVLIQGDSSVGKSEAALGLLERGHRLVSDDVVNLKRKEGYLLGSGPELNRHLMEIRGIGIINIAHIYGAVSVRPDMPVDLCVQLEPWEEGRYYDRVGLEEKFLQILNVEVPVYVLPVKQGRDVSLLIETIAMHQRLNRMGFNAAKEFNERLLETIKNKQSKKRKK